MEQLIAAKILVGSTTKALNKAKVYGELCIHELLFLQIINNLIYLCELNNSYADIQILKKLIRDIQNKNSYICNYRNSNYIDKKFINGKI